MSYQVKIPVFEGPMDLLLHLIEKNEVDIYDIPISLITQQYLDYLALAEELDLELTSEFLLLACTLLSIKARMLLPKPPRLQPDEEEVDPRQELVEKIIEYKLFKEKAERFKEMEGSQAKVFWREIDEVKLLKEFPPSNPLGSVEMEDLIKAYRQVMRKLEKKNEVVSISRIEITLQDKMEYIISRLKKRPQGLSFTQILSRAASRDELIISFLAILELARRGQIRLEQKTLFAKIVISLIDIEGGHEGVHFIS